MKKTLSATKKPRGKRLSLSMYMSKDFMETPSFELDNDGWICLNKDKDIPGLGVSATTHRKIQAIPEKKQDRSSLFRLKYGTCIGRVKTWKMER